MERKSELIVITKANDLCKYIFTITDSSPKKFRFSLISRMHNLCLDIISSLYMANEMYATDSANAYAKRLENQHTALTSLKILGTIAMIAREQNCILPKQYEQITRLTSDCTKLIGAWINSDRRRYRLD